MNVLPVKCSDHGQWQASVARIEIVERGVTPVSRAAFTADDALLMLAFPALRFAAAAIPEAQWSDFAMRIERVKTRLGQPSPSRRAPTIQLALGLSATEAEDIAWRAAAGRTEHSIQIMKVMSKAGWAPKMRVDGEAHLKAALARGNGAILWVAHFCFNTQVTKMALKERGYHVSHVSRPEHGFSASRFGIRYLNPLRWNAELKYLDRRIIIDRNDPGSSLREASAVLADNRVVSITAGAWEGRRVAQGPLLGGNFSLATGAATLAQSTGAALLPVITRRVSGNIFQVQIRRPLAADSLERVNAIQTATAEYLAELEGAVRETPDQWRGWKYLDFATRQQAT